MQIAAGIIMPDATYRITYRIEYPEPMTGTLDAEWNGDINESGMLTLVPIGGGLPHYLRDFEIESLTMLYRHKIVKVTIDHDTYVESPCDNDGFRLISFRRRDAGYQDPYELLPPNIGLRRKLQTGTAFLLSTYEHGATQWSLRGECHQCRFDTTGTAGLLLWENKPAHLGKDFKEREIQARAFIAVYSDWANGDCYQFDIETSEAYATTASDFDADVDIDDLGSLDWEDADVGCSGFIGSDAMLNDIYHYLDGLAEHHVVVNGDSAWLCDYHKHRDRKQVAV